MTPWGFTLEQAFDAMKLKTIVLNDTDPQNKYSPDRQEYNTVNMAGMWHACRYPTCLTPRNLEKFCAHHRDKLINYRTRRQEERRRKAKEAKEAYEEESRRSHWLSTVERQMDWREAKTQKPIIRAAKLEYKAEKAAEKAARGKRYSGPPRAGFVYRLYSAEQELLYVGKTYSVQARLFGQGGHAVKVWFDDVVAVHVVEYLTESDALVAEGFAIRTECPRYNVVVPAQKTDMCPAKVSEYWEFVSALKAA